VAAFKPGVLICTTIATRTSQISMRRSRTAVPRQAVDFIER
jgi:hypothetical protein